VLPTKRLEFLPGTAITTTVRVVRDECEETDLCKQGCLLARRALVVMEIIGVGLQAERISLGPPIKSQRGRLYAEVSCLPNVFRTLV
jgi:hypothetical protein